MRWNGNGPSIVSSAMGEETLKTFAIEVDSWMCLEGVAGSLEAEVAYQLPPRRLFRESERVEICRQTVPGEPGDARNDSFAGHAI
jgi:hypothetical protein